MHIENKVQRFILHYVFLHVPTLPLKASQNDETIIHVEGNVTGHPDSFALMVWSIFVILILLLLVTFKRVLILKHWKTLNGLVWIAMPQLPQRRIIYHYSMGCQCTVQWQCILKSDRKCKSIMIFAVTCNRYFYRRYKSHFKLVGVICALSTNMHVFDIKFSFISNKKLRI